MALVLYQHIKWQIIKNNLILIQLETEYPCHFCERYRRCYYNDHLLYNDYHYYICDETHRQIVITQKIYKSITLYHYLLNNLCEDIKHIILKLMYTDHFIDCIKSKEMINNERNRYINYNFRSLTIKEMKELMIQRNISFSGCKLRSHYINALQMDIHHKQWIWHRDFNY